MHEHSKFISFKESPVRFYAKGKGRAVVLLHGFLESMEMWEDYAERLSKKFRVICIDLPGHGQSGCLGYVHTMDLLAECVQAVLKHLKIRSCAFVGHSMGGYVAMAYAEMYPDNVKGICLFHSTAAADNENKKKDRDRLVAMVKESKKDLVRQMIPNLFTAKNRSLFPEEIKALIKAARKTPKQGIVAAIEGMKERREREIILRFSTYPISFVVGRHDPVIPIDKILEQAELPSNAMIHVLEDVAHMGFIEAKEECFGLIFDFAKSSYSTRKTPVKGKRQVVVKGKW